jgi:hypothetical protein
MLEVVAWKGDVLHRAVFTGLFQGLQHHGRTCVTTGGLWVANSHKGLGSSFLTSSANKSGPQLICSIFFLKPDQGKRSRQEAGACPRASFFPK